VARLVHTFHGFHSQLRLDARRRWMGNAARFPGEQPAREAGPIPLRGREAEDERAPCRSGALSM
jgi:hypothetical protein